jgi:hypothetical protein
MPPNSITTTSFNITIAGKPVNITTDAIGMSATKADTVDPTNITALKAALKAAPMTITEAEFKTELITVLQT